MIGPGLGVPCEDLVSFDPGLMTWFQADQSQSSKRSVFGSALSRVSFEFPASSVDVCSSDEKKCCSICLYLY